MKKAKKEIQTGKNNQSKKPRRDTKSKQILNKKASNHKASEKCDRKRLAGKNSLIS